MSRMFMFHLANTYFPTICLICIVMMTLYTDDSNFDTNVMVRSFDYCDFFHVTISFHVYVLIKFLLESDTGRGF